jgi:methionyl-tRNA formyltransferase
VELTIICSDPSHPVNESLVRWANTNGGRHAISIVRNASDAIGGDFLFLVSCSERIGSDLRARFAYSLVLHASRLPHGRGWSPYIWDLLSGAESITVSLLEAADRIDSGRIWAQVSFDVEKYLLWDEINSRLFSAQLSLIEFALQNYRTIEPIEQLGDAGPVYRKRTPEDSRIDVDASLASQFNLLRLCDPGRYPAFFEMHGRRFRIILERE